MDNQKTENVRALALDILLEMEKSGEYSHVLLQKVLQKYNYLENRDKAFCKRLVEGCLERKIELDYVIDSFSKTPVRKMKPFMRCLMRMSTYQLLFMSAVPDSAVCNEACKLAEKRGFRTLKGFVNGVLRNIARGKDSICYPDEKTNSQQYLSVKYSIPDWLVAVFVKQYGIQQTKVMFEGYLQERPVTIRFSNHLSQEEIERYLAAFEKTGVTFSKSQYYELAYHLKGVGGIENLEGFEEGAFYVQDVSSMLAVLAANVMPGDFVLDVCAAPGGKSMFASELTGDDGKVISRDLTEYKTQMLMENAQRMNCENVRIQCKDATVYDPILENKVDVLLADLPCSGLGILGRKPDIKYNVTEQSLAEICELQRKIIDTIWQYVKPGKTLLLSTCTIRKEENEELVEYILEKYPFELVPFEESLKIPAKSICEKEGMCQLLPGVDETDGFFFARLRRKQ